MSVTPRKSGLNLKAILVGLLVNIGGSMAAVIPVMIGLVVYYGATRGWDAFTTANAEPAIDAYMQNFLESPLTLLTASVISMVFTILGAFITAHIARNVPFKNATAMGIATTVFYALYAIAYPSDEPLWYTIFSIVIILPLALIGGRWRSVTRRPESLLLDKPAAPLPEPF
jgi:hypothetical protein